MISCTLSATDNLHGRELWVYDEINPPVQENFGYNNTQSVISVTTCDSYASPSDKYVWSSSGTYKDTIPNAAGCDSIITIELVVNTIDSTVILNQNTLIANASGAAYQWVNCNNSYGSILGETNQNYTATSDGNYAVIITQYGCTDTSACYNVSVTELIENTFSEEIFVYPNPTNGTISIDMGKMHTNIKISITELDGRVVQQQKIGQATVINLNLNTLHGVYLLIISDSKERAVLKY